MWETQSYTRELTAAAAMLVVGQLVGCGGSRVTTAAATVSAGGRLAVQIAWPAAAGRLIPDASNSLRLKLTKSDGTALSPAIEAVVDRPATGATLTSAPAGELLLTATAYPQTGAQGVAQAAGQRAVTVIAGQTVTVPLSLSSTITRVTVSPATATVAVGAQTALSASAQDASGATVLVASSGGFIWAVTAGGSAAGVDATGHVTGLAAGTATVRATEPDSGLSAVAQVTITSPTTPSATTYVVVDTGQTRCYNATTETAAPAAGQAYYGQDAQFAGPAPSFAKSADGLTVTDRNTGLTWQQSPDTNRDGTINSADKFLYAAAQAQPAALNAAGYGGYTDWRLPTIKELYSLIDFRGTDPSGATGNDTAGLTPFIDRTYFAFGYGDTGAGERVIDAQFATSTLYVATTALGPAGTMFGVNFADGRIKGYGLRGGSNDIKFYLLCVRGSASGANSFVDRHDGTITDSATGLMWTRADNGTGLNWPAALAWVQTQNTARYLGYNDWRLPNTKELQSLVDYTRSPSTTGSAAIDPLFGATAITNEAGQPDYPCYWTGTTHAASNGSGANAVYVAFGRAMGYFGGSWQDVHGAGAQRSDPKTGNPADYPTGHGPQGDAIRIYNYVRLVRGGLR